MCVYLLGAHRDLAMDAMDKVLKTLVSIA